MTRAPRPPIVVEPLVAQLKRVDGVLGLHDEAEPFDYACSLARADAIDRILLDVLEASGWSLDDQEVLDRVSVQHDGETRARILVDGQPVTPWWTDRIETGDTEVTWRFVAE